MSTMPSFVDTVDEALGSRLLGSGEFCTGTSLLDTALTLQFRMHYHLFGKGVNGVVGQVLLDDCEKLEKNFKATPISSHHHDQMDGDTSNLIYKIIFNAKGMLCFHMDDLDNSVNYLEKAKQINIKHENFKKYLDLENLYYRGLCQKSTSPYYTELFQIINEIPNESQGLTLQYLSLIFDTLVKNQEVSKIITNFPQTNALTLLAILHSKKCTDKDFLRLTDSVLQKSKFPQANECNNEELEQFHVFLSHYFKTQQEVSPDWSAFIISSMEKTFQSVNVAKSAMIYFAKVSIASTMSKKESILNFVNFVRYTHRQYLLDGEKYNDIISLINCYAFILQIADEEFNIENIFDVKKVTDKLLQLINSFYQDNNFPLMNKEGSLNWLENSSKLIIPKNVSQVIGNAWETLYQMRATSLDYLLSNDLTSYLSNAMCVESDKGTLCNLQFQYSYTLAEQRHIEPAIKILKTVLLEENPECYKAWHLLALCESIREDKENSFKIVCSVLEAMKEGLSENNFKAVDRWQIIHLKLTQLSLIEEIFGTLDALEMLPEVFELYSTLFPENSNEYDRIGKQYSKTKQYLLQMIWIFAANMYTRLGSKLDDSKNAIKEANKVTTEFKNLNCNIASGYVYITQGNLAKALPEFEAVLFYDQSNVDAIIGFAEIVFPDKSDETQKKLQNYYKLTLSQSSSQTDDKSIEVFVNKLDESAACARLKFLLEYSITKSVEAFHSPEVWWYLSLLYEKYQDNGYKEALLNCIRYKESNPIRGFRFCNF